MRGTCPATAQCPTCKGCDRDGCKGQCHGRTFGDHSPWVTESDVELARLLAEEEALENAAARMSGEKSDLQRMGEAAWERVTSQHGKQDNEDIKRRFMRFWEPGYGEKYVNDAAYWMLNYAQTASYRATQEDQIRTLQIELQQARIEILKYELHAAERTLAYMEDPYGSY